MQFTNTSSGEYTSLLWDFGDSATSTELTPTHTYAAPGDYLVTLTLTDADGTADVVQQRVRVGTVQSSNNLYLPLVMR
ncbi:MAG: PKD domain-containing protein [Caldilineaceae bacterium]